MSGVEMKTPVASWRLAKPSERLNVNPADTLPLRIFSWAFLLLAAIFMIAGRRTEQSFFGDIKVFLMLALSEAVLIYLLTKSSNDIFLGTGLKRLKTKVPHDAACPASVQIYQDGSVTGMDEGYLWVEDGTLMFKGLQSVWRLNDADVPPLKEWPIKMRRRHGLDTIPLVGSNPSRHVRIRLIDPFEDFATRRKSANFQTALSRWADTSEKGTLESLWPPLELHPGLERNGPLRHEGLVSGMVLVAINILLLALTRPDFSLRNSVALQSVIQFVVVLALLYLSVKFAWQQILDRKVRASLSPAR